MFDLSKVLSDGHLIRPEDLMAAEKMAADTGKRLSQVLIENKFVTQETLSTVFSFYLNTRAVDLGNYKFQPEATALIPENIARENNAVPLTLEGDSLLICIADPSDQETIKTLAEVSGKDIKPVVALRGDISVAIDKAYGK